MWNPDNKTEGGGKAPAGRYKFKVDDATRSTFSTGSRGVKVQLLVAALPDRDLRVYFNAVFVDSALWKVEEFCNSIGYDFQRPIADGSDGDPVREWLNKGGEAYFSPQGDKNYLAADEFFPANANNGPDSRPPQPGSEPPPHDDGDIPF